MPIIDVQRRLTQIGVIRLGRQVPTGRTNKAGKPGMRPEKLDRFRVTSASETLIRAVAEAYGGTVQQWAGPSGPEFEVITDVREFPVLVPQQIIDPNYELWGPGFRSRLCDGATERIRNSSCLCRQGANGHVHEFFQGSCGCGATRECKPTIRVSVMLADIPSIGTYKVESHGINAVASGLSSVAETIAVTPVPLPGRLTMEFVDKKALTGAGTNAEKVESRKFWVPKLIIDWLTPGQAYGGQIEHVARAALAGRTNAIADQQNQAIGAAPEPSLTEASVLDAAESLTSVESLQQLWKDAATAKVLTDQVKAVLQQRVAEIRGAGEPTQPEVQAPAPTAPEPVEPSVVEAVDAEVEPDRDEVWSAIMREAGKQKMNLPQVEAAYRAEMGHDPTDDAATGWKYQLFLTALKNSAVA